MGCGLADLWRGGSGEVMARTGKCAKCGKIRTLRKNHKDGNNQNNASSNIEYICDECHAEYHQYSKGQNSGISIGGN